MIPTWGLLDGGFNINWPKDVPLTPTRRDFLLLSHVISSIQKRNRSDHNNKTEKKPPVQVPLPTGSSTTTTPAAAKPSTSKAEASDVDVESLPTLIQALLKEESNRPTASVSVPALPVTSTAVAVAVAEGGPSKNYSAAVYRNPPAKYIAGQSIFILTLKYYGTAEGQVLIKPSTSFYPSFVQQLGDFCFRAPKEFSQAIDKVIVIY